MKKISKILLITLSLTLLASCGGSTHTHKWSSYFDNDDGTHTRTCLKDVNHIETESHTFKEEEVIVEPTEVSPGTSKMVCSKCGYTETVIIPPLGDHVFDKEVISDLYLYEKCSEYSSIYYKSCECGAFGDPNCLFEHSLLPEGYSNVEYIQGTGEQVIDTGIDKNKVSSISYNECKKGRGRLPYNYQEVEYIEFTGAQYIDTLIKGEASWEFVLDWTPQSDLECMGYKGSTNEYFSVRKGYYAVYNKSQVKPSPKDNVIFTYEKVSSLYVNDEKVLDNSTTNDVSKNSFTIGALSKKLFCNFKFYSGKATKEGKVIAEFVPSYNVETNEIGLYDITNEAFLPGIGDIKLKKGKDVTYGSRLPADYQELESITSTGTQYIDLGINITNDIGYKLDGIFNTDTKDQVLIGSRDPSKNYVWTCFYNKGLYTGWINKYTYYNEVSGKTLSAGERATISTNFNNNRRLEVNNNTYGDELSALTANDLPLTLFAGYDGLDANAKIKWYTDYTLFSLQVSKGSTLILDLVPCYQISSDLAGLFDLVNKKFYANNGTGEFIRGKEIHTGGRLPSEYQEVEYIKNIDGAYINTNYVPNNNTGFEIDYRFDDISSANCLFGAGGSDYNHDSYEMYLWDEKVQFNLDDFNDYIFNGTLDRTKISFQNNELTVSGGSSLVKHIDFDTHPTLPLVLFGLNRTAYDEVQTLDYSAYLYSFKLYEDNVLIHDYVPCYKISGNIPGLYDLVTHSFLSNAGKGSFEVGKNVNPQSRLPAEYQEVEYIESTGTQYIDTGISAVGGIKTIYKGKFNEENANLVGSHGFEPNYNRNGANPHSSGKWELGYGDVYPLAGSYNLNLIYEIEFATFPDEAYLNVNGERIITDNGQILDEDLNIWLFNNQYHEAFADSTYKGVLYYVQLFNSNNVLVGDYVPCYKKDDLSVGMYDLITNKFLKNNGTGEFIRGPEVNPQSRLPVGYQKLEYIESTGTQYIDTGITEEESIKLEAILSFDRVDMTNQIYGFSGHKGSGIGISGNTWWESPSEYVLPDVKNDVSWSKSGSNFTRVINGKTFTGTDANNTRPNDTLLLFAARDPSNDYSPGYFSFSKLYSCKIWNDGILQRDFVPCIREIDLKLGMYDLVNNRFYSNEGTGEFINEKYIGNQDDIPSIYTQVEYLESTGKEYINLDLPIYEDTIVDCEISSNNPYSYNFFYGQWGTYGLAFEDINSFTIAGGKYSGHGLKIPFELGVQHHIIHAPSLISVDSKIYAYGGENIHKKNSKHGFMIFGSSDGSDPSVAYDWTKGKQGYSQCRIFSFKYYKGTELLRDLVPVVRTSDNVAGMYDKVSGKFFINQGTGNFIVGPEVIRLNTIQIPYYYSDNVSSYNYGRVYDATINYKDGTSAKLIPAIRNSDSVLGMYDVTNNVFYPTTSEEQFKTNGIIGHHLDNGVVTKKATYDEEGEIVYTCSICGAQIHEVIPKLSYKATFTYDEGIESIKIYSNNKDPNAYEISNVGYTRNLFSYNYSKNNAGIYFEIVFKDGYTLDEIEYDSLKCLYTDEQEHKLFYMLIDDIEVNITSKK